MSSLLKERKKIALEVIDFQKDNFGIKLESLVTDICSNIKNKVYKNNDELNKSKEKKDLENIIFERLGIKVNIITNEIIAAILPLYSNKNHIFLNEFFRDTDLGLTKQDKLLKKSINKEGFVDSKNAKVGGIFSEYIHELYINFEDLIKAKLSNTEITAVILHELGHAFHACEYSDRLDTANQVLLDVAKQITSKSTKKDMTYIYRELKSINSKVTEEDIEKLLSDDKIIPGTMWFKIVIGSVGSQANNNKYDETSFEQLADNFASRFGYGRALITSLDKISFNVNSVMYLFFNTLAMYYIVKLLFIFTLPIATGMSLIFIFTATLYSADEDTKDYTYDNLKIRYKRIRNDYVGLLKDTTIKNEELRYHLENIKTMDDIIDNTANYTGIYNLIANYLIPSSRKAKTSIVEQQLLEELAANDLFVASAKLRTI